MNAAADPSSPRPLLEEPDQSLAPGVSLAPGGLRMSFSRGGGPGGQNVNKLNTKAEAWIALARISGLSAAALDRLRALGGRRITAADELHLVSDVHRSQEGNRREIFTRLRNLILLAQKEPKRRRKTRPTAASRRRRLESKRRQSQAKSARSGRGWD
ncbi:MAG: alternative ribosome rescue aminoacyl-tRNA hydrolase ArfB [Tepidisphaeraceae bacterium]